jgi:soluble lytic murein transglycosylase-like protein
MIRLTHLSGTRTGATTFEDRPLIRVGRAKDCDLQYDSRLDARVSNHHAQIILQQGIYYIVDTESTNGTLVNGERILRHPLKSGDRIVFGHPGGPEVEVHVELAPRRGMETSERVVTEFASVNPELMASLKAREEASRLASVLKAGVRDSSASELAEVAAQRIAEERARMGKEKSGNSMFIIARTFNQMSRAVKEKTRRKWVKVVVWVAGAAAVAIAILGVVIFLQGREIGRLLERKGEIDAEILAVQQQMQDEQDPERLEELEEIYGILSGSAEQTLAKIEETDESRAAQAATPSDTLERDIRRILAKFSAETYAIPPIFKERLRYHIGDLVRSGPTLRTIYQRRNRYWPTITLAFRGLGLPEEMAYVAWAESQFDPEAESSAGARGMWQMTTSTAQALGLTVEGSVDERTDVARQSRAAARHLANLLAEFGEDSFMLAMAAYNRGESGVRRALHEVAQESGGFRKEKRDFWHLYRVKKLPPETREYVPKILAAAIVSSNPDRYGLK